MNTSNNNINSGDSSWVLSSGALAFFMTFGLVLYYAGGSINKTSIMYTMVCTLSVIPVIALQWYLFGYSLTYSEEGGSFIGNLKYAFLQHITLDSEPHAIAPTIPAMTFCYFELTFAIITPALVLSGVVERMKVGYFMIFMFVWATLVYDVIAHWAWSPHGWFYVWGGDDTAGGMPIETASGFSALAVALALGPRKKPASGLANAPMFLIGGAILLYGWIGFNAASIYNTNNRSANAAYVTIFTGAVASGVWMLCDYIQHKKFHIESIINGAVAGMVCITPAAGYIMPHYSLVFGVVCGFACWGMSKLRVRFVDDSLDTFAVHGVGGFLGLVLTGVFAEKEIIAYDTPINNGGAVDGFGMQILYQLAGASAAAGWSFVVTYVIVLVMKDIARLCKSDIVHQDQDNLDQLVCGEGEAHTDVNQVQQQGEGEMLVNTRVSLPNSEQSEPRNSVNLKRISLPAIEHPKTEPALSQLK